MFKKFLLLSAVTLLSVISLSQPAAAQDVINPNTGTHAVMGTLLSVETFDRVDAWEHYTSPFGVELGVENGIYRAYTTGAGYVWGLNDEEFSDIILQVEAVPLTINFGNGYGVMCRATESGDGYYFMINAEGYFSISMGDGDAIVPLVDWQESDAIRPEIDRNVIRASCVGDALTMFVNNELVAEVTDDTYTNGFAGLSVAASAQYDVDIAFDNLAIYSPLIPR